MSKLILKLLFFSVVTIILNIIKPGYSLLFLIIYIVVVFYLIYNANKQYQANLTLYKFRKNSEIKEVKVENNYHHDILSTLIETMSMPMIFFDKDGIIIFTNDGFEEVFQVKDARGLVYKDVLKDELLNIVEQSYLFEREFTTLININNRYYQVETTPLFKDEIVFNGSIILFTDVSQIKEIEKMQKQFFSDISHELKTPMSAIIGSVEILKRDGIKNNEIFTEFMAILLKESYRMQNIISDILELSRLEQPKVSINPSLQNVESLIKESVELYEAGAKEKHISIIYQNHIKEDVLLDYPTIKTVIDNLISNAIKYSNEGIINIKSYLQDNNFIFSIQDEGMGIPKDDLNFIFDRFFQVDRSRSKKIGTGLGLSIVKKMVELNQGEIEVDSIENIGTTFIVTIPLN